MPTTRRITAHALVIIAGSALIAPHAIAQNTSGPEREQPTLLEGPEVDATSDRPGLGLMNIDGTMDRPDAPPPVIALEQIDLTEDQQEAVDTILAERAAAIDAFVLSNFLELPNLKQLRQTRDREQARGLMRRLFRELRPVLEAGTLEQQLGDVLTEDQRATYDEILAEYRARVAATRKARIEDRPQGARERMRFGRGGQRGVSSEDRPMVRELRQILTLEVPRSAQRIIEDKQATFETIVEELELDAETQESVRRIYSEAVSEAGDPGDIDRREVFRKVMAELTPEQRQAYIQLIRERLGADRPG